MTNYTMNSIIPESRTRRMTCCICGAHAGYWRQHWNRDRGFGICMACVIWLRERGTKESEIADLYGYEGINFGLTCDWT